MALQGLSVPHPTSGNPINLLKKLFAAQPAAPESTEAKPQQPPRVLTDADIAAVAGGPIVKNDDA